MIPRCAFVAVALLTLAAACHRESEERRNPMTKNNRIDYVEFAAEDLAAFKTFYGAAFGWTFQDWGPDYVSFSGAGLEGGVRGGEAPRAGTTLVILYADDLAATEKKVVAAGGVVTARHEFPGGERFHFRDAVGNELAVWTKRGE
jgi:hypothetical protein